MPRLVDCFLVLGVGKTLRRVSGEQYGGQDDSSVHRGPLSTAYQAEVLHRYPPTDASDFVVPPEMWMFCLPDGLLLQQEIIPPTCFFFVLTLLDSQKVYGASLVYQEEVPKSLTSDLQLHGPIFAPQCLCVLSRYPCFTTFRLSLVQLYQYSTQGIPVSIPVEAYVRHLVAEVPAPTPTVAVCFSLGNNTPITVSRPLPLDLPLQDLPLRHLFQCLDVKNVMTLLTALLLEHRILLHSTQYSLLTIISQGLISLLYPFHYPHVYIPVLPRFLLEFLNAPVPFLVGVHTNHVNHARKIAEHEDQLVVVNLNNNEISSSEKLPELPDPERGKLLLELRELLFPELTSIDVVYNPRMSPRGRRQKSMPWSFDGEHGSFGYPDREIRIAFLSTLVSLLHSYRSHLIFIKKDPEPVVLFEKKRFLNALSESKRNFFSKLLETQAFVCFLEEHSVPVKDDVFDRMMKIMKRAQEETDDSLAKALRNACVPNQHREVLEVPPPLPTGETVEYASFPPLDPTKFGTPREFQPLEEPSSAPCTHPQIIFHVDHPEGSEAKTFEESNVDEALEEGLQRIFTGRVVPPAEFSRLIELFQKDSARSHLAEALYKKRTEDPCLSDTVFESLSGVVKYCLLEADRTSDFRVMKILMSAITTFYRFVQGREQFMQDNIGTTNVWKNMAFWEFCLKESLKMEFRRESLELTDPSSMLREADENRTKQRKDILFSQMGSFAYDMLSFGLTEDEVKGFLNNQCDRLAIGEDQRDTLIILVAKLARVIELNRTNAEDAAPMRRTVENLGSVGDISDPGFWRTRDLVGKEMVGHHDGILAMEFHGDILVTGSCDKTAKVWSLSKKKVLHNLKDHTDWVSATHFDKDKVITASYDRSLRVWDLNTGKTLETMVGHKGSVNCFQFQDYQVVSGSYDQTLKLWDLRTPGKCLFTFTEHRGPIMCLEMIDKVVVSGSRDSTVRVWDVRTGGCVHTLTGHTNWVRRLQFDRKHIASGGYDRTIRVWDYNTGECHRVLTGHKSHVNCLNFSGSKLVTGGGDGIVHAWDLDTGELKGTLSGHTDEVLSLRYDGVVAMSGSFDSTIRIWSTRAMKCLRTLHGHRNWVTGLQFDPQRVVSASRGRENNLILWEASD